MGKICSEGLSIVNMQNNRIAQIYNRFVAQGKCADYTSRRGSKQIQCIISFAASGPKSYLAGRPLKFNDEFEINNGTVKSIELVGDAMQIVPTQPPTDPISNKFNEGYLVLIDDCNTEVAKLPLSTLCKDQNGGKVTFTNWKNLQWNMCYVVFPKATGIDEENSLLFYVNID